MGARNVLLADTYVFRDAEGNEVTRTDLEFDPAPHLLVSTWRRSAAGRLLEAIDPAGRSNAISLDTAGRVQSEAGAGVLCRYERDECGRVVVEHTERFAPGVAMAPATSPLAGRRAIRYDGLGRMTEEAVGGATVRYAYDSIGRLRAVDGPANAHRESTYDLTGHCRRTVVETGPSAFNLAGRYAIETDYDRNGNVVARRDGLARETTFGFDDHDRLYTTTAPNNETTIAALDGAGRPQTVIVSNAIARINQFDAAGRCVSQSYVTATGAVQAMAFEYDGLGRCVRAADPQGTVVTRRYSLAGRLLREAQDGFEVGYEHEAAGLVTAIVYPSATRVDVHRYPNGRVESILVDGAELARYKWLGDLRRARTSYALFTDTATGVAQQRQIIDRRDYKRDGTLSVLEHVIARPRDRGARHCTDVALRVSRRPPPQQIFCRPRHRSHVRPRASTAAYHRRSHPRRSGRDPPQHRPGTRRGWQRATLHHRGAARGGRRPSRAREHGLRRDACAGQSHHHRQRYRLDRHHRVGRRGQAQGHADRPVRQSSAPARAAGGAHVPSRRLRPPGTGGPRPRRPCRRAARHPLPVRRLRPARRARGAPRQRDHGRRHVGGPLPLRVRWQPLHRGIRARQRCRRMADRAPLHQRRGRTRARGHRRRRASLRRGHRRRRPGGRSSTLVALQDHDDSVLGLVRMRQTASRYEPLVERYRADPSGRTVRLYLDPSGNATPIGRSASGHVVHFHGQWLHEPEGLVYFGNRWYDPDLGVFLEPEPQGAWADGLAAGNGYGFAAGNPVLATDAQGEAVLPLVLVLIFVLGTGIAAEVTRNKTAMSFSPAHNLVRGIMGHEIDDPTDEVAGLERALALIDAPLTILSLGGAALAKWGTSRLLAAARRGWTIPTPTAGQYAGKVAAHVAAPLTARQTAYARHVITRAQAAWVREGHALIDMATYWQHMPEGAMGAFAALEHGMPARIYLNTLLRTAPVETIERCLAHECAHLTFAFGLGRVAERVKPFATGWLRISEHRFEIAVRWLDESLAYGVEFGTAFDFARAMQSLGVNARGAHALASDLDRMANVWLYTSAVVKAEHLGVSFAARA